MAVSVPFWFGAGVLGGLSANIGLMQLNTVRVHMLHCIHASDSALALACLCGRWLRWLSLAARLILWSLSLSLCVCV